MNTHDFLKRAIATLAAAALAAPQGALVSFAAEAAPVAMSSSAVAAFGGVEVSDDLVAVKVSTSVQYNSFLTQIPPRLVLELFDVKHEGKSQSIEGRGKFLKGVRTSQFEKSPRMVTRVVLDLIAMAGYKIGLDARGLSVQLVGSEDASSKTVPTVAPTPSAPPVVARRAARVIPKVAAPAPIAPAAAPAVVPAATPAAVAAPVEIEKPAPLPVKPDFSAAAAFKRAGLHGKMTPELAAVAEAEDASRDKASIPAELGEEIRPDRRLGGRIFRDMLSRLPKDAVTLDFDNTDIRDIIKLLAAKAKINIIYGTDVSGSLTLHLSDVPFNEAFRTVLSMMQLSTDQVGDNILRVITPAELIKQRTSATNITKVIPLNYAKASEVKTTIDSVRLAEGRTGSSSVDSKTNSIIITESLEGMLATENLIAQLDQRPRQVIIEAKLVEVNSNVGLNYGVQWDTFSKQSGRVGGQQGETFIGTPVGHASPNVAAQPYDQNNAIQTDALGFPIGSAGRGTGVALAADRVFGALTLGRVTNNYLLNATITAAASQGKAKVLSDPKIATLNNQPANINVTTQIPYVTSNVSSTGVQTQSVTYVTTGIQLTVTPSINADGRILLVINPSVSQPSVTAAGSTQTGAPAIDSRNANTTVLVRDGETIVIGGLINDTMQETIAKIPLLGDIPILGWLFKKKSKTRVRNELLIFVTTRILAD